MDFWAVGQVFLGLSTTVGAVNFIVTILRMRTPGMSLGRMPLFVWGILSMSFMIIFAVPSVTLAGVLLELQRMGMHFFTPGLGGDPMLYQHLFWIWGHPEVYLLFIPATGIISMIIPAFTHRADRGVPLRRRRRSWPRHSSASVCGCTTCSPSTCRSSSPASSQRPAS